MLYIPRSLKCPVESVVSSFPLLGRGPSLPARSPYSQLCGGGGREEVRVKVRGEGRGEKEREQHTPRMQA